VSERSDFFADLGLDAAKPCARAFHLTPPLGERREISLRHDKVRVVVDHPEITIPISESSTRRRTYSCGYGPGVNQCQ